MSTSQQAHCRLSVIKNTSPRREHGDIAGLRASIKEVGLINPLTIDENHNLLAGRRRYQALIELFGPETKVEVRVLPVNGNPLQSFKVAIDENLHRKSLTDPEVATAIKAYDDMKREIEGERGAARPQEIGYSVTNNTGWSYQRTAEDLGISKPAVVKAIQIATALEEHPDLANLRSGQAILTAAKWREARREAAAFKAAPHTSQNYHLHVRIRQCNEEDREYFRRVNEAQVKAYLGVGGIPYWRPCGWLWEGNWEAHREGRPRPRCQNLTMGGGQAGPVGDWRPCDGPWRLARWPGTGGATIRRQRLKDEGSRLLPGEHRGPGPPQPTPGAPGLGGAGRLRGGGGVCGHRLRCPAAGAAG